MNMDSWTVRMRLSVGFGVVCALLLVIVIIGLGSMGRIDDAMNRIVHDSVPKRDATSTIVDQSDVIGVELRDMMLTTSMDERKRQLQNIAQARQVISKNIELLDRLVTLPKGKEMLQRFKDQRVKYVAAIEELSALIMADKDDQARTYLVSKLRPALAEYQAAISALGQQQVELMEESVTQGAGIYSEARVLMIGLGVLALALSGAIALVITRKLVHELGGEPHAAAELARAAAQGDFTYKVAIQHGDTSSLLANLSAMQLNLAKVVGTVRHGSEGVAMASAEIAAGNNDLSARTEQQASALEQTAASMEELGSTVKQNADSARQANQLAQSASTIAVEGGNVVGQVVETMKGINESSRKISDIISVIDGIAFQTNILALNAAVEAARAGEQGRGFAVVASEVRSLAGRSAEAAKEIKSLINASVERVEHGTTLVDQAGVTMAEVVTSIKRVTDIMGEISAASSEQSLGVAQVGEAVTQMDQTTQQNAALVEEMAAAASSLKSQAQELVQAVAFFKVIGGAQHAGLPRTPVRSSAPSIKPFKGPERRVLTSSASARRPAAPASAPPSAAAAPASQPQAKADAGGADDGWETF